MTGMTRGTMVMTRERGVTRGGGMTRGVRTKGTRGVRMGVPGARTRPGHQAQRRRGKLCVWTRERGPGARGLIGLTELITLTHHQVTWC